MALAKSFASLSGTSAVRPATSSAVLSNGGSAVVDAGRVVYNDEGSTIATEFMLEPIAVQFADGVVAASHDLVVKLDADGSTLASGLQVVRNHDSGYLSIGKLWVRAGTNKIANGSNLVNIERLTQSRTQSSAIALSDIAAEAIVLEVTSCTDYAGNADGSGTYDIKLADYITTGEPATTITTENSIVRAGITRTPALDRTGGAAHPGGLYAQIFWEAVQSSGGSYSHTHFKFKLHMGNIASSDPDVRKYTVAVKVGGVTIRTFTAQYLPYFSKSSLGRNDGRAFCTNTAKTRRVRNVLPTTAWQTLKRLPPWRAKKFNDSGTNIITMSSFGESQTIPTVGGDKGKVTVAVTTWLSGADAGGNWVRFRASVYPSDGSITIDPDLSYCLGADTGSGKRYLYLTRDDAVAGTNKLLQGTVVAGTSVVMYPAQNPMSMPMGVLGWGTGGDRAEIGIMSSLAWPAIMQPSEAFMDTLRCNAANQDYIPFHYRGTTTYRVPDIHTTSASYAGLGTGFGYEFSYDSRDRSGVVGATDHTNASWWLDTFAGIAIDSNHPPTLDAFATWLHEPHAWHEDSAISNMVGQLTWNLDFDRSPTWNSVLHVNGSWGTDSFNNRALAWLLRSIVFADIMLPESVVTGNNGERSMMDAIGATQDTLATNMLTEAASITPNALEMGILPIHRDDSLSNWQIEYMLSVMATYNKYTGHLTSALTAMKPFGQAIGGNVPAGVNGSMGPTRAAMYYPGCRTYTGVRATTGYPIYDAPAQQWDCYGDAGTLAFGSMTINTTNDTVTIPCSADRPNDGAPLANGDLFTALKDDAAATIDSAIGFGAPKYIRDISFAGLVATFKLENSPGSGALNLTDATTTNVKWATKRASERSFGFCNTDLSDLMCVEAMESTYWLAWALGGMDDEVDAVNTALKNATAIATEFTADVEMAKHCMDDVLCKDTP